MTTGAWQTGKSHEMIAAEFGVSPRTAEAWAATASKAIKLALGEGDDIRTRLAVMLETIQQKALTKQSATMTGDLYDSPDLKSAVLAIKTQAELLGLVTQQHKVDMNVQQFEQLEPAAMRAKLLEQRAKIDAALKKLDDEEYLGRARIVGPVEHPRLRAKGASKAARPVGNGNTPSLDSKGDTSAARSRPLPVADPARLAGMQLVGQCPGGALGCTEMVGHAGPCMPARNVWPRRDA